MQEDKKMKRTSNDELKDTIKTALLGVIYLVIGIVLLLISITLCKIVGVFCICTFIVFEFFAVDDYIYRDGGKRDSNN